MKKKGDFLFHVICLPASARSAGIIQFESTGSNEVFLSGIRQQIGIAYQSVILLLSDHV